MWSDSFALVDEVWAISEFSRRAIAAATEKPVFAFPLPVVAPQARPGLDRATLGLPGGFLFLFCFDFASITERKNPHGLIRAFSAAFAPGEGPTLVLKAVNGTSGLADLEALKLHAAERPDIMVIDRYLDHDEIAALMAACDCYASLHRSEGFGLTMAESMALGKPVIATGYSGNLDFMDDRTAYLVPWTEGVVPANCAPYPEGARWAEPDLDAAAQLMRRVVEHPDEAAAVGARAQHAVLTEHGLAARAAILRERFDHAQAVLSERSEAGAARGRTPPAGAASTRLGGRAAEEEHGRPLVGFARSRARIDSPSRFPLISQPLRRAVARITAHADAHRAEVDARLAESIASLEARLAEVDQRLSGVFFETRAQPFLASETAARVARLDARVRALALGSRSAAPPATASQTPAPVAHLEESRQAIEARVADIDRRLDGLAAGLRGVEGPFDELPGLGDPNLAGGINTPANGGGM